jgi:hypothetical protein
MTYHFVLIISKENNIETTFKCKEAQERKNYWSYYIHIYVYPCKQFHLEKLNNFDFCRWLHENGLNDPAPTNAPSKTSYSRISWMGWNCPPRFSLCFFFFFLVFFFPK